MMFARWCDCMKESFEGGAALNSKNARQPSVSKMTFAAELLVVCITVVTVIWRGEIFQDTFFELS